MSRSVARTLASLVNAVCSIQSARQAAKTKSELIGLLQEQGLMTVETDRGPLRFHALRGRTVASQIVRFNDDEPETLNWIRTYPKVGETVWDIGACIGTFALYAALDPGIKVLAFEPQAMNFGLLNEHIFLNDLSARVAAYCIALSDRQELDTLELDNLITGSALNSLSGTTNQFGGKPMAGSQAIPAMTVDGFRELFGLPAPDHIKLDVDGIEGAILRGAEKTLPHVRSILVEVEGDNALHAAERIEPPLKAAGFTELAEIRDTGSCRNRLYVNTQR